MTGQPRALILTNHLHAFGGSEILSLEVAETLVELGFSATIHCNALTDAMQGETLATIAISDGDAVPDLQDFDFVWIHHLMGPLALGDGGLRPGRRPLVVSAHLSPFEPFEHLGLTFARDIRATIVANSAETAGVLGILTGAAVPIVNLHNACPDRFWTPAPTRAERLTRVLVVSNHVPEELARAAQHAAAAGVTFAHVGKGGTAVRLKPEHMDGFDAVVSIGKTVQYAMMRGKPVYCYDHFGGPGWLTEDNQARAEAFNYSGRCTRTRKDPAAIAEELVSGYGRAADAVLRFRDGLRPRYSLQGFLKALIARDAAGPVVIHPADAERLRVPLMNERTKARVVRDLYRHQWKLREALEGRGN